MSARSGIVDGLVEVFKTIDGTGDWDSNLFSNVSNRKMFWDEVADFPYVSVSAGSEGRQYLPSDFKWGFLQINIAIYVRGEDPEKQMEDVFRDIELAVEQNRVLNWDPTDPCKNTADIQLLTIESDEGIMKPLGIGEMTLSAQYEMKF